LTMVSTTTASPRRRRQAKLMLSPEEVAQKLGVGRSTIDRRMRAGEIPSRRIGARWLIPASWVHEFVNVQQNLQKEIVKTA